VISRNVHSRSAVDDSYASDPSRAYDLSEPPESSTPLPPEPGDTTSAMLGEGIPGAAGAVPPSEAGPIGQSLAGLGMVVQGLQILSLHVPGFVPMEVTAWTQQAMQVLPQLLQQMQSGLAAAGSGMLPGVGQSPTGAVGPMGGQASAPPQPAGPPQSMM
jgi:hypothetical protein